MKRHTLTLLALCASLLTTGNLLAQGQPKTAAAAAKPQKMVKVATLSTVEANREFQSNVQLLQAQRQKALELNAQIEKEKDASKKKTLQKELDTLMAKLNENNQAMMKMYGFSLTRNYTMDIEKSHIYVLVSEDEAAEIEKAQQAQEKATKTGKK